MLGVVDRIDDELTDMVTVEPVEDGVAVPTSSDQPGEPKLGQVLRHGCGSLVDQSGELADRLFLLQTPQDSQSRAIRQHPKQLDGKIDFFDRRLIDTSICIHT